MIGFVLNPLPGVAIINIDIDPVFVRLGPFAIHWYGLMYVLGLAVGLYAMIPYAIRRGFSRNQVYDVFWPVLIASLIGGRLYYVVQSDFGWYLRHPQNILATWEGGMAFYGAVIAGFLMLAVVCRLRGMSFPAALDCATLLIPIAQSFGRIGNIINGDILGYRSTLPWATRYINPHNTFVPSHRIAYQPAAAYELLFSLALVVLVFALRFRFRVPGTLFAVWLVAYSAGQFVLFFGRANAVVLLGLKQAQVTALVMILICVPVWLLWRRHYLRTQGTDVREEPSDAKAATEEAVS